jgi:hypothetical protein
LERLLAVEDSLQQIVDAAFTADVRLSRPADPSSSGTHKIEVLASGEEIWRFLVRARNQRFPLTVTRIALVANEGASGDSAWAFSATVGITQPSVRPSGQQP